MNVINSYRFNSVIDEALKFTIDTSLSANDGFIIPTDNTETYLYDVDWGDANTSLGQIGDASHTYLTGGIYQITITGTFPKFLFISAVDRLKITSIDNWGVVGYSLNQSSAFNGCTNLSLLADDMAWVNSVTNSSTMFTGCNNLNTLPIEMTLSSVTNGTTMFSGCGGLTSIEHLTLDSLTNGRRMFRSCGVLATLNPSLVLSTVTDGRQMFENCNIVNVPSTITLGSLTLGLNMFLGNTINTTDYSQLINNIDSNNSNTGVIFHGGASTYNNSANAAHNNLTIIKGWDITDGSLAGVGTGYILDDYPSARFGFSLRKLSSASTVAIRVRRSSDNTEQDIGFIGDNLDTTALTTFVGANDGFITIWYNQGAVNSNFVQTTIGNEPKIMTAGVILLNSLLQPTISFASGSMTNANFNCQENHTSIMVSEWAGSNLANLRGVTSSGFNWCFRRWATNEMRFRMNGTQAIFFTALVSNATWINVFTRNDGADTMELNSNGVNYGTQAMTRAGTWVNAELGYQNTPFNELIVFDGHQTENLASLAADVNAYYGVY